MLHDNDYDDALSTDLYDYSDHRDSSRRLTVTAVKVA